MLQVATSIPLGEIEHALRQAARHHGAGLIATTHVGQHLPQERPADAFVFSLCHPELYGGLLEADIRMAAFLPCRIAAHGQEAGATLISVSPLEFGRLLHRPDLAPLLAPLEELLLHTMEHAAQAKALAAHAGGPHRGGLGATEDQMSQRGLVPQRIDCRGTKVEDLAGTGEPDSRGG